MHTSHGRRNNERTFPVPGGPCVQWMEHSSAWQKASSCVPYMLASRANLPIRCASAWRVAGVSRCTSSISLVAMV